jgi:hypothetical protein
LQFVVNTNKSYAAMVEFFKAHIQAVIISVVAYFSACMGQMLFYIIYVFACDTEYSKCCKQANFPYDME